MAAARNSLEERGSRKINKTSQGMSISGAWRGSLWLCYARSFAGKPNSGISSSR